MTTYQKHHYAKWVGYDEATGLAKVSMQPGDALSKCTRCEVTVKLGPVGGQKFWVNGKWVSKRPVCRPVEGKA